MTSPSKPAVPDSVTLANLKGFSVKTEEQWKQELLQKTNDPYKGIGPAVRDNYFDVIADLARELTGIVFGRDGDPVGSIVGNLLGLAHEVELHTKEIVKLENVAPLEGVVPAWVSVDLQDMPTVPRTMLRPRYAGVADNQPQFALPSETPGWADVWLAPIVSDREAVVDKFKIITGAQSWTWGSRRDYWELGLYRLNEKTQTLELRWSSGDVVAQLAVGAREYALPTGGGLTVKGGEIWFAAQLQNTTSGLSSNARTVMVQENSTTAVRTSSTLKSACYGLSGQAQLPSAIPLSSMWVMNAFTPYMALTTTGGTAVVPL